MAEELGGLSLPITADFSGLDADFQAAVALAVSQGATLAEAINRALQLPDTTPLQDALALIGGASDAAAGQLGTMGDAAAAAGAAAGGAASGVKEFGDETQHAGEHAHEAEGGFAAMAEQLLIFGEALAVTEKLAEFGQEALKAYDSMQRATNSLTALTGSAETAREVIEGIEKIAATQPFSFPELAGAAQKMAAFGIEAEKIPELLTAAGNASRATGNSFEAIASALERVSIQGAVTGRQLVQLGVNWGDLAEAAGKSISETQAMLKKGGQDAAADLDLLLKTVEQKFSAFSKVPLSISEQWIVLENQIHTVFVDIGEAIAPVIQKIVGWFQSDLVPAIKSLTEWFKQLPEPIKDFAVAIGLAIAAIAPLAVGIAGFGLAVTGLSAAVPALAALIEGLTVPIAGLGLAFSEVLIPIALVAAAIAAVHFSGLDDEAATFASNLKGDFEGIADLFQPVIDAIKKVGSVFTDIWGAELHAVVDSAKGMISDLGVSWDFVAEKTSAALHSASSSIDSFVDALKLLHPEIQDVEDGFARVGQVLGDTTPKQEAFFAGVSAGGPQVLELARALAAASNALDFFGGHYQVMTDAMGKASPVMAANAKNMHDLAQAAMEAAGLFDKHALSTDALATATQKLYDAQHKANTALDEARQVLAQVRADLDAGTASQADLNRATAEYEKAQKAANVATEASKDALKGAKDAAKEFATELKTTTDLLLKADDILAKLPVSTKAYLDSLADGGKNAKQIWDEISALIQKASDKTLSLKGEPLAAIQSMIEALKEMKEPLKEFADAGEFSKIATALGDLDAKVGGLKADTLNMFNNLLSQLAEIPGSVATNGGALIKWIQTVAAEDEKLDKQHQQLQKTFEKAGDVMAKAMQQQAPIIVDLRERLAGIDVTFQGLAKSSEHLWDVSPIGAYLNMVKAMNAEGFKTVQQQEAQIAEEEKLLAAMEASNQPYAERLALQGKILQGQAALDEMQGKSVEAQILGLEKIKLQLEANRIATHGLADTYVGLANDVGKAWDQMGKAIADNIIDGKNWGKVWEDLLKNFAKSILETVIHGALDQLKAAVIQMLFGQAQAQASTALTTAGLNAMGPAATSAASSLTSLAAAAQAAAASINASVDSAGGGGGGGALGTVGTIATIAAAGAAIASAILLAHISSDTGHIEVNTRSCLAELENARKDAWSQFNSTFDRLGELKNDLDTILATLQANRSDTLSGGIQADLDILVTDANLIAPALQTINTSVLAGNGLLGQVVSALSNINDGIYQLHSDLAIAITKLDTVVSSILYGGKTNQTASQDVVDSIDQATESEGAHANAMLAGLVRIGIGVDGVDTGTQRNGKELEKMLSEALAQRSLAASQYASAVTIAQQVAALQAKLAADNQAILAATRLGQMDTVKWLQEETVILGKDITALIPQIGTVNSSAQSILSQMVQGDANQGGYVSNSTTQIVGAVYGAGSMIANAVGVAIASIGGYNSAPGGGTTQYVPKKTPPTYQQGTESQNPGNSNSPTGNTGQDSGTGAQGGYSVPKHENIPPPITGSTQYAPGSTTQNGGNAPYNPLDPFTWTSGRSPNNPGQGGSSSQPAQYDPYHIPSYDGGGISPVDMLSLIRRDEMVLPPDISLMLRRMAQVPTVGGSSSAFAGAAGGFQGGGGTVINMPVTFNGVTNGRELMDLWTQQVKRIIPRATVFSS